MGDLLPVGLGATEIANGGEGLVAGSRRLTVPVAVPIGSFESLASRASTGGLTGGCLLTEAASAAACHWRSRTQGA